VGADAGVAFTLLTHFSARYPKLPVLGAPAGGGGGGGAAAAEHPRAVVAYDGALTGAPFPESERALDAAFADAERGLAVSEPGRLWVTADGGERWARVPLADAPLRVFADARGLFAQGRLHRWRHHERDWGE
jgi:hypothetical protein